MSTPALIARPDIPNNQIFYEEGWVMIQFRYSPALVDAVKLIHGRTWHPAQKCWRVPTGSIREIRKFAEKHNFQTSPEIDAIPDMELSLVPSVEVSGEKFHVHFAYDRDLISKIRDIPTAKWSKEDGCWRVDTAAAQELTEFIRTTSALVNGQALTILKGVKEDYAKIALSSAKDADIEIPTLMGTLRPFQKAGIVYALQARRTFIADEMGLGKTVQAIATLEVAGTFPAVIVCPSILKSNWQREFAKWLPHRSVEVLNGSNGAPRMQWSDVIIINYDILHGWVNCLPEIQALVVDESHYTKSTNARRSKAAIELADKVIDDGIILCLSGTPVLNNSTELIGQLRILKRLPEFGGVKGFRKRYGNNNNLVELNRKLRSTCFIRRRKDDVLSELPPKQWATIYVDGETSVMKEYRQAEDDLIGYLAEKARRLALESGMTSQEAQGAAWIAAMKASAAEHLVAVTALKQLAAKAKMQAADEWIREFLESGKKLVAFGWHRVIVDQIADKFANGQKIQGGMKDEDRQATIDRFQTVEEQKVISCNIKAGGVGLTLTAASDVAFFELGWNPGEMDQAADRCHRIGQRDSVTAWQILTKGTIDEDIAQLIEQKRGVVDAATDGVDDITDKTSILGDLLVRLASRGM
jgi:SWI/SNF-related matrix-associated actin-dependent regulator 1 of chromatin subfamily A